MAFAIPNFSRKQITKAGKVLVEFNPSTPEHSVATTLLNHWRSCHTYPINTFQATLRARLKKICASALVATRLKRTPSIVKKLQLNPNMQMARMQDIGGLRAVVDSLAQVRKLEKLYTNNNLTHQLIDVDDYIENPKASGYRSLHLIYKYQNPLNGIYDGLCVEIQIRTKLQHAWATAVETIGTFLVQALKSNEGPEKWLDYFKLVSAAFALLEKSPVPIQFAENSANDIYRRVVSQTKTLDVKNTLGAYAIAAKAIQKSQSHGNYHLVILNAGTKVVQIRSFGRKRLDDANIAYAEAERDSAIDENIQAVLVATDSIEKLKKAFPNYFLDTRQFADALARIEKIVQNL